MKNMKDVAALTISAVPTYEPFMLVEGHVLRLASGQQGRTNLFAIDHPESAEFITGFEVGLLMARLSGSPSTWRGAFHVVSGPMLERAANALGYQMRSPWADGVRMFCDFTPTVSATKCCERDHDGDGNCDRHPGKHAAHMAAEARTYDPRPGDCYARRYDVEGERRHVRVRMLGMGEDKPLVGVTRYGDFTDHIMTRAAFDDEFVRCPAEKHDHQR